MPMTSLIDDLTPTAAELVCAVEEMNQAETHRILRSLGRRQLQAVAIILAASVDMDRPLGAAEPETTAAIVSRIATSAAEHMDVRTADVYGSSRQRDIAAARHVVCWVGLALGLKASHVGRALDRDHSTVIRAAEKATQTPRLLSIARKVLDEHEMKGVA